MVAGQPEKCATCGGAEPKPDHQCSSEALAKAWSAGEMTSDEIVRTMTHQVFEREWPTGASRSKLVKETAPRVVFGAILGHAVWAIASIGLVSTGGLIGLHWTQSALLSIAVIIGAILWATKPET